MTTAVNVKDYACARMRRRLDSYLAGELSVDLSHEILEHLDRCPECREELKAREGLRAAVRRIGASTPEPREGFEAELRARLARVPAASAPAATALLLAASLVAAAGAGTLFLVSRAGTSPERVAAVQDARAFLFAALNHRNCTLRYGKWATIAPPRVEELGTKLEPELRAAIAAAAPKVPDHTLVAAHECSHAGEKIFHLIYRKTGETKTEDLVSVVATRPGSNLAGTRLAGLVSGGHRDGLAVVGTTAGDGTLVFLVTNDSDDEAMRLGKAVLPTLSAAFAAR